MIAFTSPNATWFSMASKYEGHRKVFMPNWDLPELMTANDVLHLQLTDETILTRFAIFGGTARYTLTTSDDLISVGREEVEMALSKISSLDDVDRCFKGNMDLNTVVHRLMHYAVSEDNWKRATLKKSMKA
jgi:hypothetical protein